MDVIRHDDETASEPMVTLRAVEQKRDEALECFLVVEDAGAAINAWRQQIGNVSVAIRPYAMETAKTTGWMVGWCRSGNAV